MFNYQRDRLDTVETIANCVCMSASFCSCSCACKAACCDKNCFYEQLEHDTVNRDAYNHHSAYVVSGEAQANKV